MTTPNAKRAPGKALALISPSESSIDRNRSTTGCPYACDENHLTGTETVTVVLLHLGCGETAVRAAAAAGEPLQALCGAVRLPYIERPERAALCLVCYDLVFGQPS